MLALVAAAVLVSLATAASEQTGVAAARHPAVVARELIKRSALGDDDDDDDDDDDGDDDDDDDGDDDDDDDDGDDDDDDVTPSIIMIDEQSIATSLDEPFFFASSATADQFDVACKVDFQKLTPGTDVNADVFPAVGIESVQFIGTFGPPPTTEANGGGNNDDLQAFWQRALCATQGTNTQAIIASPTDPNGIADTGTGMIVIKFSQLTTVAQVVLADLNGNLFGNQGAQNVGFVVTPGVDGVAGVPIQTNVPTDTTSRLTIVSSGQAPFNELAIAINSATASDAVCVVEVGLPCNQIKQCDDDDDDDDA